MEIIFTALFYFISGLVILFHSWGFWHVYKKSSDELSLIGKGAMAGLTGWFWTFFFSVLFLSNGSGFSILALVLVWIYGLLLVPLVGILFIFIFLRLFKYFNIEANILIRALAGLIVGIVSGVLVGLFMSIIRNDGVNIILFVLFITPIAFASAIMARYETND